MEKQTLLCLKSGVQCVAVPGRSYDDAHLETGKILKKSSAF